MDAPPNFLQFVFPHANGGVPEVLDRKGNRIIYPHANGGVPFSPFYGVWGVNG